MSSASAMTPRRPEGDRHIVQLDGLRAVAIVCVMIWHFLDHSNPLVQFVQWGWVGVRLFFVLSGFLITGILLRAREQLQSADHTTGRTLRNFYIRRFLRIFPVYYAFVFALFLVHPDMRRNLAWFVTYLQNVMFAVDGQFSIGAHLWTLAVEEQFYLIWPWLILYLPQRWLMPACVMAILLGPLSRAGCLLLGWSSFSAMLLTSSNMDTLAMGSLLALLVMRCDPAKMQRLTTAGVGVGLPLFAAYVLFHNLGYMRVSPNQQSLAEQALFVSADFGAALTYTYVIHRASTGIGGPVGWFLSWTPVTYIGTISYGLYLVHDHVKATLVEVVFPRLGWQMPDSEIVTFLLFSAASIAVAAASWHFFEKPLNDLKRHFRYVERSAASAAISDAPTTRCDSEGKVVSKPVIP